jgi:cobalt-zinc-cadmium efflux system outer membrane protein
VRRPPLIRPAAGPAAPLTLAALLAHADAHAPAVRVALADAGVADAARLDADPLLPDNPTLGFAIGRRTSAGAAGIDYEITLQQRFEIAGERALRQTAAARALDTARAAVDAARWQVHVEVHHRFVDLLVNAERREQAGHFVALAESVAATTRRQVEAGEVSPLVLLVAEADVAESREASITAEREQQALEAAIAAAIGWPDPRIPAVAGTLPPVRPAPPIEALIDQMNTRHPALRTQAAAVREARADAALEAREGWPEPTIGLSYGQEAGPGPEADAQIWMVGLSLPIPVARTRAAEQARAAAEIVRRERLGDATAARLRADLVEAASEIDAAAARVALYREAIVPRLQENLDRLRKAHALGEVDVHQVSSTRQRLLQATGRYLDARARYHEATAALEALVGTEVDHVMEAP